MNIDPDGLFILAALFAAVGFFCGYGAGGLRMYEKLRRTPIAPDARKD